MNYRNMPVTDLVQLRKLSNLTEALRKESFSRNWSPAEPGRFDDAERSDLSSLPPLEDRLRTLVLEIDEALPDDKIDSDIVRDSSAALGQSERSSKSGLPWKFYVVSWCQFEKCHRRSPSR